MTPTSPYPGSEALVTFSIRIDGAPLSAAVQVASITTRSAVNEVPDATIEVWDGSPAEGDFPLSAGADFVPGRRVEIAAGYDGRDEPIFSGVIVRQRIEIDADRGSLLAVDLADEALGMTLARQDALFADMTDADVIRQIIDSHGLSANVAATAVHHEQVVQYYCTDWDFMLARAQANGQVVVVDAGAVTVAAPDTSQPPALVATYGEDIIALDAELDAPTQFAAGAVTASAWDVAAQALATADAGTVPGEEPGNLSSEELAQVFGVESFVLQTGAPIERAELEAWSTARLERSRRAKVRGTVRFPGSSLATTGGTIRLSGLGDRFNGSVFVSGVRHVIASGAWTTSCRIGLSPDWFAPIATPRAGGLVPAVSGLQTGIVTQTGPDPEGRFRVQVEVALLGAGSTAVWARLSTFAASPDAGAVFFPEVGDEVVLGFMNDDPRHPVVLGSLYSSSRAPTYRPSEENLTKAIVTKGGLEIVFDDDAGSVVVTTPGGQRVELDDEEQSIALADMNANTVTLSAEGIWLKSAAGIVLEAATSVSIAAPESISIDSESDVAVEGRSVAIVAESELSASAGAMAELTSGGELTVAGAIVMIN